MEILKVSLKRSLNNDTVTLMTWFTCSSDDDDDAFFGNDSENPDKDRQAR